MLNSIKTTLHHQCVLSSKMDYREVLYTESGCKYKVKLTADIPTMRQSP